MTRTEDFLEIIEILECNLIQEKKRVLTLAALCEPILNLSFMLDTYGQVGSKYCGILFLYYCCYQYFYYICIFKYIFNITTLGGM